MKAQHPGESTEARTAGPYRLEKPLGQGGMGTVWRAWDDRLKRPVALKRLLPEAASNPTQRERFRREAQMVARLNHPSIVHVYDILEAEGDDWIVLELVEGRTLRQILREGPLPLAQAIRLAREIAEGLAEAHRNGIIHRDLKASNIIVAASGHARILDFGISKQLQPTEQETTLSQAGLLVGTSYAMSPEQAQGLPLDTRSDLFSLGSLLYEMATGTSPFLADTPATTLTRICTFRQPSAHALRPEVPRELSDLIDQLLEKNPADRPQSAEEAVQALELLDAALRREAVLLPSSREEDIETVSDVPPFQTFETVRGRSRFLRFGLVLLVLLVLGLVSAYFLREGTGLDAYASYQQGMALLARPDKEGNLDEAVEIFRAILAEDGGHAPAYAALAKAYLLQYGDNNDPFWLKQALPTAQQAVQADRYLSAAWVSLALAHVYLGQQDEARREIREALQIDSLNADAYFALARLEENQSRLREAEAAYEKAIAIRPDRFFYDDLGALLLRIGKTEEAFRCFRKSIEIAPDSFTGYRNLGVALFHQGKLAEATSQLQKALEIRREWSIYANLGTVYFAQGLYPQSAEAFEAALKAPGGANSYLLWSNLGDAYRWSPGGTEKAQEAYQRSIQILREQVRSKPERTDLRSRLAMALAKRGDREQALAEVAEMEKLPEIDAQLWYRLAVIFEITGRRERALAALERALRAGHSPEEVRSDPELLALRQDARYHRMITGLEKA